MVNPVRRWSQTALLAVVASAAARAQVPDPGPVIEVRPTDLLGGVNLAPAVGRYGLLEGKEACAKELSVLTAPGELWVVSPQAITNWKRSEGVSERPSGMILRNINGGAESRTRPWTGPFPGQDRVTEEVSARAERDVIEIVKDYRFKDPYARLKTHTSLRFTGSEMTLRYRDSSTGAPLETGFWESLGLKGKKLDLDLDCRYVLTDRTPYRDEPVAYTHHEFRVEGSLCSSSCILHQKVVVTAAFDMEADRDVNGERLIRDLKIGVELEAGGALADQPAYATRLEPVERRGYAKQNFRDGTIAFFIEVPMAIGPEATGTVLADAQGNRVYLKLYPYCDPGLARCRLGTLAGIDGPYTGMTLVPRFRLVSEAEFPVSSGPAEPRFIDGRPAAR